jgi:hypothetical protein
MIHVARYALIFLGIVVGIPYVLQESPVRLTRR